MAGLYSPYIRIRCAANNHEFEISYAKKLHCISCLDCRKLERETVKQQLRDEESMR